MPSTKPCYWLPPGLTGWNLMVHEIQKVSGNDLMSPSSLKLSEMVKILLLKEMADEQLPGSPTRLLPQLCLWGAVLLADSQQNCTIFTPGDQILIPILLCSLFAFLPLSNTKNFSAPLCGDHLWEKLLGFASAFTKIQMRYLFYLVSAFHIDQIRPPVPKYSWCSWMQKSVLCICCLCVWLRALATKSVPVIFLDSQYLLFSSSAEKMCNLKLWACIFLFLLKYLQRWPELLGSHPACTFSKISVSSLGFKCSTLNYFHMKRETWEKLQDWESWHLGISSMSGARVLFLHLNSRTCQLHNSCLSTKAEGRSPPACSTLSITF